jgi:pyruvate/2-oxoglutarate/acetoin dehydrogenase E1 component
VTIVAYAYTVPMALAAAERLAAEGIEAEVVDLRSIDPIDEETILASVRKTNRLVVVQETWRRCSVSSEVAAIVAEGALDYLDAPVIRVTGADVPVPAAPILERYVLPGEESIIQAVRRSVGG